MLDKRTFAFRRERGSYENARAKGDGYDGDSLSEYGFRVGWLEIEEIRPSRSNIWISTSQTKNLKILVRKDQQ